jgi:fructokinase
MGGGVMQQVQLFLRVRQAAQQFLNGYIQVPALGAQMHNYIVPPGLGSQAGVLGALALARHAVA